MAEQDADADGRTLELGVDKLDHWPMLRNLVDVPLLRLRLAREQLLDLVDLELAELRNSRDAALLCLSSDVGREVRELEELGRRRVDGLEEELLEVEDGDVGGEPVVREGDGGEAGAERKGD